MDTQSLNVIVLPSLLMVLRSPPELIGKGVMTLWELLARSKAVPVPTDEATTYGRLANLNAPEVDAAYTFVLSTIPEVATGSGVSSAYLTGSASKEMALTRVEGTLTDLANDTVDGMLILRAGLYGIRVHADGVVDRRLTTLTEPLAMYRLKGAWADVLMVEGQAPALAAATQKLGQKRKAGVQSALEFGTANAAEMKDMQRLSEVANGTGAAEPDRLSLTSLLPSSVVGRSKSKAALTATGAVPQPGGAAGPVAVPPRRSPGRPGPMVIPGAAGAPRTQNRAHGSPTSATPRIPRRRRSAR